MLLWPASQLQFLLDTLHPQTHKSPPSLLKAQARATTWSVARLMTGTHSIACSSQPNMFCSCCTSSYRDTRDGEPRQRRGQWASFSSSPPRSATCYGMSMGMPRSLSVLSFRFLGYPILKTLEPMQGLSPSLSLGSTWPWLTEVRSFNWMHFLSSTTWPRRPMVNWRVKRDPVDPAFPVSGISAHPYLP